MNNTDPIADMLTRIRNGIGARKKIVDIPHSIIKEEILKVIKNEGYITEFKVEKEFPKKLVVELKYKKNGKENVIDGMKKISKPGRRVYSKVEKIPKVLGGMGVAVLSTSRGIKTGKECEKQNIGGEILFHIW